MNGNKPSKQFESMEENQSFEERPSEENLIEWKNYTVAVLSASSDKNVPAMENSLAIGKILARNGYDARNGGYSVGGMKGLADGFREQCREDGLADGEIQKHLSGVVFTEKAIGEGLARSRGINETAEISRVGDDWWSRSGGIINPSDVMIVLEGGIGTFNEGSGSAMGEWFVTRKNPDLYKEIGESRMKGMTDELRKKQLMEHARIKPIISLDATRAFTDSLKVLEDRSPGTADTISEHIYILTGHSKPGSDGGGKKFEGATVLNDPEVAIQLQKLLRYYYLLNLVLQKAPNQEEKQEQDNLAKELFDPSSQHKVLTLKEHWSKHDSMEEGAGI